LRYLFLHNASWPRPDYLFASRLARICQDSRGQCQVGGAVQLQQAEQPAGTRSVNHDLEAKARSRRLTSEEPQVTARILIASGSAPTAARFSPAQRGLVMSQKVNGTRARCL